MTVALPSPMPAAPMPTTSWLERVPARAFTAGLGLSGLGMAWRMAASMGWMPEMAAHLLLAAALLVTLTVTLLQGVRLARWPGRVAREFRDPAHGCFFAGWPMSLMILSVWIAAALPTTAAGIWLLAVLTHLLLAVLTLRGWLLHPFNPHRATPAMFLPIAGLMLAAATGGGFGYDALSWWLFSLGGVFWLVLMAVVTNRLLFHPGLPEEILPSLFILAAPPSLGVVAVLSLGEAPMDLLAHALMASAMFLTAVLISMANRFVRVPYSGAWWSFTFPSAAVAVACLSYGAVHQTAVTTAMAVAALALASGLGLLVMGRTLVEGLRYWRQIGADQRRKM